MVNEELPVNSARDLSPRYEAFSEEDTMNMAIRYSSIRLLAILPMNILPTFGQSKLRKRELTQKDIRESLRRLPDEDVYPEIGAQSAPPQRD
jgi:hypothetical protein